MRFWILILVVTHSTGALIADDRDAEIARLKTEIDRLGTENRLLRERLSRIAELSSNVVSPKSTKLAIGLGSDDWGDADKQDVLEVVRSAAVPVWKAAGSPALHPITVLNDSQGPLVSYERGPGDAYRVLVDVEGREWAQLSYQFSHEMAHILANYREGPNKQKWFEESICECASLYSLFEMGKTWKTAAPYPNWTSYAGALTRYAQKRIDQAAAIPDDDLAAWYATNRTKLESNATLRDLNLIVAVRLLKICNEHPNYWTAIRSLNLGNAADNENLERYLEAWYGRVAEPERVVVRKIAGLFSLTLPE